MGANRHIVSFIQTLFLLEISDSAVGSDAASLAYGTNKSIVDSSLSLDSLLLEVQSDIADQYISVDENVSVQNISIISVSDLNEQITEDVAILTLYDIQVLDNGQGYDLVESFHIFSELPKNFAFSPGIRLYLLRRGKILTPGIQCYLRNELGDIASITITDFTYINATLSDVAADM